MNTVKKKSVVFGTQVTATNLIHNMRSHGHTAFVGRIGRYNGLFLITYESVVLASAPNITWSNAAEITIDHYCDVTITED